MSRLYAWIESDSRKTSLTTRGHENIQVSVNWGSRGNSKKCAWLSIVWEKDKDKPEIYFRNYLEEEKEKKSELDPKGE